MHLDKRRVFRVTLVVGNMDSVIGLGTGSGLDAPSAIINAQQDAFEHLHYIPVYRQHTIYHPIRVQYQSSIVEMMPKPRGHGLRC